MGRQRRQLVFATFKIGVYSKTKALAPVGSKLCLEQTLFSDFCSIQESKQESTNIVSLENHIADINQVHPVSLIFR